MPAANDTEKNERVNAAVVVALAAAGLALAGALAGTAVSDSPPGIDEVAIVLLALGVPAGLARFLQQRSAALLLSVVALGAGFALVAAS